MNLILHFVNPRARKERIECLQSPLDESHARVVFAKACL